MTACALSTALLFFGIVMGMVLIVCGAVSGVVLVLSRMRDREKPERLVTEQGKPRWGEQ